MVPLKCRKFKKIKNLIAILSLIVYLTSIYYFKYCSIKSFRVEKKLTYRYQLYTLISLVLSPITNKIIKIIDYF
jgi:hypothetical protein